MSEYDLERVTVLLAEDSQFIRSLLINSLKILGVGKVIAVEDGGQAIEFLQLVKEDPMKAQCQKVDILLSNWDMSPVDGMMFLRWVRRHKLSPDRYVPFIMITGYTEPKRIIEAREMGVTEMLAKPFTISNIAERLKSIIERPRQFVHNASYFGPDRRRQAVPFEGENRRFLTEKSDSVEIVRG